MKYSAADEQALMTELWDPQIADDLEQFVLFAYPWGKANTPLCNMKGPRSWQRDDLQAITEHIKKQKGVIDQLVSKYLVADPNIPVIDK